MAGSKTSSLGILLVIQAKECHMDSKKAQGCVVFTLQVLSEKAQGVAITDFHAGNPCVHICDPTTKANDPIIEGMDGRDCQELVTDFRPRTFLRVL
ncbi:hypothetical protein Tco_1189125 [Tanacetum coccineum]